MHELTKIVQEINKLKALAQPPDNSAPLAPVTQLGHYVLEHWEVIERALIETRQLRENQERQRRMIG